MSPDSSTSGSYKYQWARYVARKKLEEDTAIAVDLIKDKPLGLPIPIQEKETIGKLLTKTQELTGLGFVPPKAGKFKVGIVGAGVSGLFSAMVFDWLNENLEKDGLRIDYDIIEAAGEKRLGGRLYTHEFSEKEHDYYDVGAMRFPNNKIMKRTFQLFDYIGIKEGKGGLIPYYMTDGKACPSYFNDIHYVGDFWEQGVEDPFSVNTGMPDDAKVPTELFKKDPGDVVGEALAGFIESTKAKFAAARDEVEKDPKGTGRKATELWKHLIKADHMSVRQFLSSVNNGPDIPAGPGYNFNTIEWLETATYGTGWYDQALSECILEELDFKTPKDGKNYWYCIEGGAQKIAKTMATKIKNKPQFNNQVVSINANVGDRLDPNKYVPMTLGINRTEPGSSKPVHREEEYFAVFNSTTLSTLQRMDLKNAGLLWGTKQAIRALGYGASCKVAIKFKKPWWQLPPFNINKGGVSRTDLPLRVCVYPSYNIKSLEGDKWDPNGSSVLLCSYTWGQDAQRLGSLISPNTPEDEEQLKSVLLHDLALLHASEESGMDYDSVLALLNETYDTHHAWDWYRDQNMSGAFAYFGPGQFSNMWEEIIKPNAFGQLYLVGEAASSHHAWIVGALESVIRAVYVMFEGLSSHDPSCEAYQKAMKLLEGPPEGPKGDSEGDLPTGLPFWPLPEEMPERQMGTARDAPRTHDPTKATDKKLLTYPAAIASLSLIESRWELLAEAGSARAA